MEKREKLLLGFLIAFYLLNIVNTFFVTTELLNKYITVFPRSFLGEINAFIGNFAALTLIIFSGFLFIKKVKSRLLFLIILTFALNFGVFGLGIFSKYYQTVFSLSETTLFKNPALDLASSIFIEALKELLTNYRVLVFSPTIILLIYYFVIKKEYKRTGSDFNERTKHFSTNLFNGAVILGSVIFSLFTLSVYNISMNSNWPIFAERPLYGVQRAGLYNYYLGQAVGFDFNDNKIIEVDIRTYREYNKNQELYTNIFGEKYGNILYQKDLEIELAQAPILNKNNLNGIFKDKNLVLIHLESFNHFLLNEDGPYLDETYLPTLKKILEESYVLDNFYTNVGLGNSSDAEFSVITGIYPPGDSTVYWNYNQTEYVFEALPKLFQNRYSVAFHGDVGLFYNRQKIYDEMFEFDNYFYFDKKEEYYEGTQNGFWQFPDNVNTNLPNEVWLTENELLEWLKITYHKTANNQGEKGFYYPILMNPHTPYLYNPTPTEELRFNKDNINLSSEAIRYLNFETYIENFFKKFVETTHELKDTVYIFYGDHGSGISQKDYEKLFDIETTKENSDINDIKYYQEMIKTLAFIYVPDDNSETLGVKPGLLKGVQPRVRSQIDIYRTIVELFGLETDSYYYGVNLLSTEHTFAIDTRNFNIVTDDYFMVGKKMIDLKKQDNRSYIKLNENPIIDPNELFNYVIRFKNKMDLALKENVYQYLKN